MITAITVNYNTPEYLERLLKSFRKFYDIPLVVVDGSEKDFFAPIKSFDKKYKIELYHFDYNIHHGPGMAWAAKVCTTKRLLFIDSDMIIHNDGWLDSMQKELRPESYGIGDIQKEYYIEKVTRVFHQMPRGKSVSLSARMPASIKNKYRFGVDIKRTVDQQIWIPYLHPALALVNREVFMKYPMPIKGGAPFIPAMTAIWKEGNSMKLLQRAEWLTKDLWEHKKRYVQHNDNDAGMGTVVSTGGYHYEEPKKKK